jgi:hypothetical protein
MNIIERVGLLDVFSVSHSLAVYVSYLSRHCQTPIYTQEHLQKMVSNRVLRAQRLHGHHARER